MKEMTVNQTIQRLKTIEENSTIICLSIKLITKEGEIFEFSGTNKEVLESMSEENLKFLNYAINKRVKVKS